MGASNGTVRGPHEREAPEAAGSPDAEPGSTHAAKEA